MNQSTSDVNWDMGNDDGDDLERWSKEALDYNMAQGLARGGHVTATAEVTMSSQEEDRDTANTERKRHSSHSEFKKVAVAYRARQPLFTCKHSHTIIIIKFM